jgi:hypothetical protein
MTDKSKVGVYVIYCWKSLDEIKQVLKEYITENSVLGPIKIDFSGSKETNRNVCVMSKDIYDSLLKAGHDTKNRKDGLSVARYHLNYKHYPYNEKFMNIFVKLPRGVSSIMCRSILTDKLNVIKKTGLYDFNHKIDIPLKSRVKGQHFGKAIIKFDAKEQDRPKIALINVLLNNSQWGENVGDNLRVFTSWARTNGNNTKRKETQNKENRENKKHTQNEKVINKKENLADE